MNQYLISKLKLNDTSEFKSEITKYLYFISVLCYFLSDFHFKFFWTIPSSYFLIFNIFCFILYYLFNKQFFIKEEILNRNSIILSILFSIFIIFQVISNNGIGIVGLTSKLICGVFLILTPANDKYKMFQFILKIYVFILTISLLGWVAVNIFNIKLPMHINKFEGYYFYDYYIFNMRVEGTTFSRYLGMFLEPGHTGTLSVLLFIANGGSLKNKENILLLIAILFTLSFASYILLCIYIFLKVITDRKVRSYFLKLFPIVLIILFILYQITYFKDIIDYYILRRVMGLVNGKITGNRFSNTFEVYYKTTILGNLKNLLLGVGSARYNKYAIAHAFSSAGYKVYIAQNGLIGLVIVIIYYLKSFIREIDAKYFILFIVWFFSFLDISYPIWGTFIVFSILAPYNLKCVDEG